MGKCTGQLKCTFLQFIVLTVLKPSEHGASLGIYRQYITFIKGIPISCKGDLKSSVVGSGPAYIHGNPVAVAFRQLIKHTWIHQNAVGFSSLSIQNQFLICDFCAICVFDETILPVFIQRRSEVIEENLVFSRLPCLKIGSNRHISKLFI